MKAIVIGSGVAGMASAIRLASKGLQVQLFEAAAVPGGKVAELRDGGFRWDKGPSLFTLPELLDDLFQYAGEDPSSFYSYAQVDPISKYFFPDGRELNAWSDPEKMAEEFEQKLGEPKKNLLRYLKKSSNVYELTEDIFLKSSLHRLGTYAKASSWKTLAGLPSLDAFSTLHKANARAFEKAETIQFFDRYATYNGSNPFKAPATLKVIAHLEHNLGAFFLHRGMRSLIDAMYELALRKGVQFHFEKPVERILVEGKRVRGVIADGTRHDADLVVSNADVVPTYKKLMPDQKAPASLNRPKSTSALIFYLGMNRQFPEFDLHNILFGGDYKKEFRELGELKQVPSDPTVYLYISSKHRPEDAIEGGENWFAMINVPHLNGQNWEEDIPKARKTVLERIQKVTGIDPEPHIVVEHQLNPQGIQDITSSHLGALYGNASDDMFAAFLRHANFSGKLKGLYFCGGSVHPGGGVPLCLLSAKITCDKAKSDFALN